MSTVDFNRLKLLAVFVEVVSCGSFAAAARKLRSSRSRVSEQVAQLESSLGCAC
ncbi:LysR family transcriptional regulator [Aliamphritea spongicola]|nr:LysR family transcriptional regulator [Aliamphritea spongicola]